MAKVKVVLQTLQQTMVWRNVNSQSLRVEQMDNSDTIYAEFANEKEKKVKIYSDTTSPLIIEEE